MAKTLADKYGASSVKKMKKEVEREDSMIDSGGGSSWIDFKDGVNKVRIMPTEGDEPYAVMRKQHWLEFESDNEDGKTYKGTVLNAITHGGQIRDVIECYIEKAKKLIEDSDWGSEEKKEALEALTGQYGLKGSTSWIAYGLKLLADKKTLFGLAELKKVVRDRLNEEAIIDDEEDDEGIDVDPYTHPKTGKQVILTYNSKAKHWSKYWKVRIGKKYPLTQEHLEQLDAAKPLNGLFYYELKDFEKAVEGLRFFDEKNEIGLFEEDDWNDLVDELEELLKNSLGKDSKKSAKKTKSKPVDEDIEEEEIEDEELEDEEEDGDEFDEMDRKALKKHIVKLIKDKKAVKGDFKIRKSSTDDEIREMIRVHGGEEIEDDIEEEDEEDDLDAIKRELAAMNEDED